ncbi:hypothetical protein Hanom_Chr10g00895671 [Helianthus anomalus]
MRIDGGRVFGVMRSWREAKTNLKILRGNRGTKDAVSQLTALFSFRETKDCAF